jgi:hypothetical protein
LFFLIITPFGCGNKVRGKSSGFNSGDILENLAGPEGRAGESVGGDGIGLFKKIAQFGISVNAKCSAERCFPAITGP